MFQEERLNKIIELLNVRESLTKNEIMEELGISRDTARRDIVKLTEEGSVIRTHGGITLRRNSLIRKCYNIRRDDKVEEKKRIAKAALRLVEPEKTYYFDASTTIYQLCKIIPNSINAYSNSLDNVQAMDQVGCKVHIMGGTLNHNNKFIYGQDTMEQISKVYYDAVFLGVDAIMKDGAYTIQEEDAPIKKLLAQRSRKVYVVTEYSKFETEGTYKCFGLENIDVLITDKKPTKEISEFLEKNNIEIIVAE